MIELQLCTHTHTERESGFHRVRLHGTSRKATSEAHLLDVCDRYLAGPDSSETLLLVHPVPEDASTH